MKIWGLLTLLCIVANAGCKSSSSQQHAKAEKAMRHYGCVSCHSIPGIAGARATVGPPLDRMGSRTYIAGTLQNTPENLEFWIQHPQEVHHGTAMPEMHVTSEDAQAISRYLDSLH